MPKVYRSDLNDVYDVTQEEFDTLFTYTDEQGNLVEIQGGLSAVGYTTDYKSLGKNEDGTADTSSGSGSSGGTDGGIDYSYALSVANTLYGFLPESIVKKFAEGYVEYGGRSESTRLNSSHTVISYAVFCLKKKNKKKHINKNKEKK